MAQAYYPEGTAGFLGLGGYYHKFIRHYVIISHPLTNLLKKGTVFIWTRD
jgi:hypothetical protein